MASLSMTAKNDDVDEHDEKEKRGQITETENKCAMKRK
jgi:hypothetical protein